MKTTNAGAEVAVVDEKQFMALLDAACAKLGDGTIEIDVDCSSVMRVDAGALNALQGLAESAESKGTRITLRGVNVELYKVLKVMRLARRFSFAA